MPCREEQTKTNETQLNVFASLDSFNASYIFSGIVLTWLRLGVKKKYTLPVPLSFPLKNKNCIRCYFWIVCTPHFLFPYYSPSVSNTHRQKHYTRTCMWSACQCHEHNKDVIAAANYTAVSVQAVKYLLLAVTLCCSLIFTEEAPAITQRLRTADTLNWKGTLSEQIS